MKTKNRLFALLLALAMIVTYMPAMAFADPGDPPEENGGGDPEITIEMDKTTVEVYEQLEFTVTATGVDKDSAFIRIYPDDDNEEWCIRKAGTEISSEDEDIGEISYSDSDDYMFKAELYGGDPDQDDTLEPLDFATVKITVEGEPDDPEPEPIDPDDGLTEISFIDLNGAFLTPDETDWAYFFSVDPAAADVKDRAVSLDDLGLKVYVPGEDESSDPVELEKQTGDGQEAVDNYSVSVKRVWYDEDEEEDMEDDADEPFGVYKGDQHKTNLEEDEEDGQGFTEYVLTVEGNEDAGYEGEDEVRFVVMDKHSLNYICSEVSFDKKSSGLVVGPREWRMTERFYFGNNGNAKVPIVRAEAGREEATDLREGTDYTVSYYKRNGDDPYADDAVGQMLKSAPESDGKYFARITGKGDYYGTKSVMIDIGGVYLIEDGSPFLRSDKDKEYSVETFDENVDEDDIHFMIGAGEWDDDGFVWDEDRMLTSEGEDPDYTFENGTLTISGEKALEVIGEDELWIHAWIGDEDDPDAETYSSVKVQAARKVSVTLDVDETNLLVNEELDYSAEADGEVDCIRIYPDYGDGFVNSGNDRWYIERDRNRITSRDERISYDRPGTYNIVAVAYEYSEDDEEDRVLAISEKTEITVTSNGRVGQAEITVASSGENNVAKENGNDYDLEVTRGDTVTVVFAAAEDATNHWIDVFDDGEGEDEEYIRNYGGGSDSSISFNTIELAPGNYHVYIAANDIGLENNWSSNRINLTVKDMVCSGMYFDVSKDGSDEDDPLLTSEEFTFSAYCKEADWIEVDFDNDEKRDNDEGDAWYDGYSYGGSGDYSLTATAYAYNEDDDKDKVVATKTITMHVTAPNGWYSIDTPAGIPAYITEGTDTVPFTYKKPANDLNEPIADGIKVQAWFDRDDYDDDNELYEDETEADELKVNLDTSHLEEGDTLRIRLEAWGRGYEWTEKELSIPVIEKGITVGAAEIIVDPDILTNGVVINTDFDVVVKATGDNSLSKVQLYDGRDFHDEDDADGGSFRRDISFDESGTYNVFARVLLDGTWVVTPTIAVTAYSYGRAGSFDILKVDNKIPDKPITVTRGDTIDIECGESVCDEDKDIKADHYWIDAEIFEGDEDDDDGWWRGYGRYADADGTNLSLNTIEFEPGKYRISVGANAVGYEDGWSNNSFELVVEPLELDDEEMYFEVPEKEEIYTSFQTNEEIPFSVYCPEADWIEVDFGDGEIRNNHGGESWHDSYSYANRGEYKMVAKAYAYDKNKGKDVVVATAEKTINVAAPYGSYNIVVPQSIPSYIEAGTKSISFTFNKPVNEHDVIIADGIRVEAWFDRDDYEGDSRIFDKETKKDSLVVNLDTSVLEEGDILCINLGAWGLGYEYTDEEIRIPVTGTVSDAAVISVDLGDEETLYVNEDVMVTVAPTGYNQIKKVQLFDGYHLCDEDNPDHDGSYSRELSFDRKGSWTVYARVKLESDPDTETWVTTKPVSISVDSIGKVGSFDITQVNDADIEDYGDDYELEVEQGDIVTLGYTEADNADHYWIDVDKYDENREDDPWQWVGNDGHTNQLSTSLGTALLEPGSYRLRVAANGARYETTEADHVVYLTVNESDQDENELSLKVSNDELITCEGFTISAYCHDAEWIEVYMDYDHDRNWKNDNKQSDNRSGFTGDDSYGSAGTYKLTAIAYDKEDQVIDKATHTMTVFAPNGDLSIDMPELPAYVDCIGLNNLTFELVKPQNADMYSVRVFRDSRSENGNDDELYYVETEAEELVVTVPAGILSEKLENGDLVRISIEARGYGYNSAYEEAGLPALESVSDDVEITVPESAVRANDPFEVEVDPPQGQAIDKVRLFNGYDLEEEASLGADGKFKETIEIYEAGTYSVYAMVKLKNSETWLNTSPKTVTVTSSGRLELDMSPVPEWSHTGEAVSFTVAMPENGDHMGVTVWESDDRENPLYDRWTDDASLEVSIPASKLAEEMVLNVEFKARGAGYDFTNEMQTLHIWDPVLYAKDDEGTTYNDKDSLKIAPGASAFVSFVTDYDANLRHGVAPIVGYHELLPDGSGDLTDKGFTVTTAYLDNEGNVIPESDIEEGTDTSEMIYGLLIEAKDLSKGVSGTLHYTLHRYDGDDFWDDFMNGRWSWEGNIFMTNTLDVVVECRKHAWNDGEETTAPSCTQKGVKTYTCTVCGETKTEDIDALGHNKDYQGRAEATCTEAGHVEYWYCDRCRKYFSNAECTTELTDEERVIPATNHEGTCTKHDAAAETRDALGNAAYWDCTKCGKYFADNNGAPGKEISKDSWVISDLHDAKKAAREELEGMDLSVYDEADRTAIQQAINTALAAIDDAESVSDVNTARKQAVAVKNSKKTSSEKAGEKEAADKKAADELKEWNGTQSSKIPAVKGAKFKAGKKSVTVSWTKATKENLKKFDKVEVQVCATKKFDKANTIRKEVKKTKKSVTVKSASNLKLQSKKKYYVRVRNVKGSGTTKTVSKWSAKKRVTIK